MLFVITVNNKMERIWQEALMTKFKLLSWCLTGGTAENYGKSQSGYLVLQPRFEVSTFYVQDE